MPFVRITRAYPWKGRIYRVGSEIEVPQWQAERMAAARPPFAEIFSDEQVEKLTQPPPESEVTPGGTQLSFTSGATGLLDEAGVTEDRYTGDSNDGRVTKAHVKEWLEKEGRS